MTQTRHPRRHRGAERKFHPAADALPSNVVGRSAPRLEALRALVADALSIFLLLGVILLLSTITLLIGVSNLEWMRASASTPWGVGTAIVVHSDVSHYAGNMIGLLFFLPLFAVINMDLDRARRTRRALAFSVTVLVAAVVANAAWVLRFPTIASAQGVVGASGVVYAAMGAVAMFALFNTLDDVNACWRARAGGGRGRARSWSLTLVNLAFFLAIFAAIMFSPGGFLGVGQGVNVLSHGIAVIVAAAASMAYRLWWESSLSRSRESAGRGTGAPRRGGG